MLGTRVQKMGKKLLPWPRAPCFISPILHNTRMEAGKGDFVEREILCLRLCLFLMVPLGEIAMGVLANSSDLPETGEEAGEWNCAFLKQLARPSALRLKLNLSAKPKSFQC